MKRKITILLATGIIVTLVAFSLVFVKAASSQLYQYTFKDLTPNKKYKFHFCVNDNFYDQFARGSDTTDYGFDRPTRYFRYPPGYTPPSIEVNLTENQTLQYRRTGIRMTLPLAWILNTMMRNNPGNVNGYAGVHNYAGAQVPDQKRGRLEHLLQPPG